MRWKTPLVAVTAAAAAVAVVPPASAAPGAAACADVAVFETDGYGHGETLTNWRASAFNQNPPPGYQIIEVPYYAGVFPVVDEKALDESVAGGAAKLDAAVRAHHAACPQTQLRLAGYSEGAVVAGEVLEQYANSTVIPHHLLSGTLYGNPRRSFGEGGRGGVAGGIETNLPTILPGVTMLGGRDFGDIPVRDVCNENDGICNSTNMITNLAAFANGLIGYASGDHGYVLDPAVDTGDGLTFHTQTPRIGYGPPLPIPVGTPWQIQQLIGGASPRAAVVTARDSLQPMLPASVLAALQADPWYRIIAAA
ncbi:cutinase family protein [Actinokineospora sp. G85]|uniref:cutinase family protein n=1 Tax=Actinokineospora sp. G85 TaxID=3406626 RepID=UPI003C70EB86